MKTETILQALAVLEEANDILYCGRQASIAEQMRVGGKCSSVAYDLKQQLLAAHPEVKVEVPA